ncbi:GGDEF domain-containing protein [Zhengella mangrovi]|uniref:diguanylate cyclase n=1 Tax=Zhengella mangrovi TaxID=1982044 RepID=A0A2G1QPS2_9HYPH|nr:GGDEF domain-containing protein [Zhengella mangrovi]PHP67547.1 GGDEF domain-containing protein [Zhengella mangrovi]
MRFHKAELAFFILLALLLGSAGLLAAWLFRSGLLHPGNLPTIALTIEGVAVVFGGLYFYPVLRRQVREESHLRAMTQSLSRRSEDLQHAALTDGLTGMQNRRYFDDALAQYLEEFSRINRPVGLMILDLDHFKLVNDTHGHDVGDEVLKAVAACLREFTRYHDVVARLGGEEFAIVAPNMDSDALTKFADRIRMAIGQLTISAGNVRIRITTSVGVAIWNGRENSDALYRRADAVLYKAKREGRNRVCTAA